MRRKASQNHQFGVRAIEGAPWRRCKVELAIRHQKTSGTNRTELFESDPCLHRFGQRVNLSLNPAIDTAVPKSSL